LAANGRFTPRRRQPPLPRRAFTVWVALIQTSEENGAPQVLPRTHLGPDLAHEETYAPDNMLARGQSLRIADESSAATIALQSGEFSLHHERTAHGSKQNLTAAPRIGFAFFYIPTHVRSTMGRRSATLVRGVDRYGLWDPDPLPRFDLDPVACGLLDLPVAILAPGGAQPAVDA
jgi:non-haem Fe2+, alpha-ketoglutarate-dependent halogenase